MLVDGGEMKVKAITPQCHQKKRRFRKRISLLKQVYLWSLANNRQL